MNKFIKYTLYTATLLAITFGVGLLSYRLSDFTMDSTKTSAIGTVEGSNNKTSNTKTYNLEKSVPVLSNKAKFTFESDYTDKESEIKTIDIPIGFIGWTKESIETSFSDWDVVEFSENLVYFKKTIETPEPVYVLTSEEGQLVVYYKDSEGNITLEEETGVYIETLPEADIEQIERGILYKNKTEVIMALQNYDS